MYSQSRTRKRGSKKPTLYKGGSAKTEDLVRGLISLREINEAGAAARAEGVPVSSILIQNSSSLAAMGYRELQKLAKAQGINAGGTAEEIRLRLIEKDPKWLLELQSPQLAYPQPARMRTMPAGDGLDPHGLGDLASKPVDDAHSFALTEMIEAWRPVIQPAPKLTLAEKEEDMKRRRIDYEKYDNKRKKVIRELSRIPMIRELSVPRQEKHTVRPAAAAGHIPPPAYRSTRNRKQTNRLSLDFGPASKFGRMPLPNPPTISLTALPGQREALLREARLTAGPDREWMDALKVRPGKKRKSKKKKNPTSSDKAIKSKKNKKTYKKKKLR